MQSDQNVHITRSLCSLVLRKHAWCKHLRHERGKGQLRAALNYAGLHGIVYTMLLLVYTTRADWCAHVCRVTDLAGLAAEGLAGPLAWLLGGKHTCESQKAPVRSLARKDAIYSMRHLKSSHP